MLSLDYELFFGRSTGSVQACLVAPVEALSAVMRQHGARMVMFVDASYLVRLRELRTHHAVLSSAYDEVRAHLEWIVSEGHELQLHVHPHWIKSTFDDGWNIDPSSYRLHNFPGQEQRDIVAACKKELEEVAGAPVNAFRAGGWCIQPFGEIRDALQASGIWLDSTLYRNGVSTEANRFYDFRNMPDVSSWRFDLDPMIPDPEGAFVEIPISSMQPGPLFFWQMALTKKLRKTRFVPYGDGASMTANTSYYLRRLFSFEQSPVSIDGLKATLLESAFRQDQQLRRSDKAADGVFNIMGHPKSLSPESIDALGVFLARHQGLEFRTFADFARLAPC